jgi:hypothetical protein
MREICSAGSAPNKTPVNKLTPKVNLSVGQSTPIVSRPGIFPATIPNKPDRNTGMPEAASASPAIPPSSASNRLSTKSCRTSRPRPAPIAGANPHLTLSPRRLSQQQVGDICACDQQDERDGRKDQQNYGS